MVSGVCHEGREDDWKNGDTVGRDELDNVIVVPEEETALGNLEVLRKYALIQQQK